MGLHENDSSSCSALGEDGLQLKIDRLLCKEDDNKSNLEKDWEEGIRRKEVGESNAGSISAPNKPLQIFVLASVALPLKAAPDRQEKELLAL